MRRELVLGGLAVLTLGGATFQNQPVGTFVPGLYAISYRLEMPHLERYSIERLTRRCVSSLDELSVLGAGATFDACARSDGRVRQSILQFEVFCPGKAGARAKAVYRFEPSAFRGRIAITLGAKNMTMVEVQDGARIGSCP